MTLAWKLYRKIHATYEPWQFARGIHDGSFSCALKTAWRITKARAAEFAKKAKEITIPAARAIRTELETLVYLPTQMDVRRRRAALQSQFDSLVAA